MGILLSKGIDREVDGTIIEGASIYIKGTEIELTTVYVRIHFNTSLDGRSLMIYSNVFLNHTEYVNDNKLLTNINTNAFEVAILETEKQSIDTALIYTVEKFISYGFNAVIV